MAPYWGHFFIDCLFFTYFVEVKKHRKLRLAILILLGLVLVVSTSAILYLNAHLEDLLKEQIKLHTEEDFDIDFKSISINALSQSAEIDEVEVFKSDSGIVAWSARVEQLIIKELSVISLIRSEGVKIDSIILYGVDAVLHVSPKKGTNKDSISVETELKQKPPLQVNGIRISAGNFDYDPPGPTEVSGRFSFSLSDFRRDSSAAIDLKAQFLNSQFAIHLDKLISEDSLYSVDVGSIRKPLGDSLFIDSLSLSPTLSLGAFTKYYGWNKGMLEAHIPEIKTRVDLASFPDSIRIPFCSVKQAQLHVNKDNRWPFPDRVTLMPQEMLSQLPFKFRLDSLAITEAEVTINLIQENGKEASLNIQNTDATVAVQNINKAEPALILNARHSLMGKASGGIETTYYFGDDSPFDCSIMMENSKLDLMSEFLQKAIGIEIKAGELNRLNLDMIGNKYSCSGELIFEYRDLSIAAVDKETGEDKKMLNALATVLGGLVFWKDNPAHEEYRKGTFFVERDVRKAFMAQWFEGLEAGIINVVAKIDPIKARKNKKENKHEHKKRK